MASRYQHTEDELPFTPEDLPNVLPLRRAMTARIATAYFVRALFLEGIEQAVALHYAVWWGEVASSA